MAVFQAVSIDLPVGFNILSYEKHLVVGVLSLFLQACNKGV
jgi:hypothetical protein